MKTKVLVCPNAFKGSLAATAAAAAIARGIQQTWPEAEVQQIPLADGGEGTVEAFLAALGGQSQTVTVAGPLGDPVVARFGLLPGGRVAIVELAQASGLTLVAKRDPGRASTHGTGEVILAACQTGAEEIWVGLGGSASTDGGAGIGQALGYRLLDAEGQPLDPGGVDLLRLERIVTEGRSSWLQGRRFRGLCDVHNPLTGPTGAAAVFGPQKGATPELIAQMDRALERFAQIVKRDLQIDIAAQPGCGAAGGAGGGLRAFVGAELESGIELLLAAVDFPDQVAQADWVITGEGRLDEQSLMGKALSGVLRAARHKPVLIMTGSARIQPEGVAIAEICSLASSLPDACSNAASYLEQLAATAAREFRDRNDRYNR